MTAEGMAIRRVLLASVVALVAATAATAPAAPQRSRAKTGARDPEKAPAPPPDVSLSIEAPTTHGPWTMRVTNDGDVPAAIVADARLLALEVTPRGARAAVHCELPEEMRPQDDLARPLVVPPKRSYVERFEPRLYCLENARLDALAPGAIVVARLGWRGNSARPPLEVSPVEGMESQLASSKAITSLPIALPDEPTPAPVAREPAEGAKPAARLETLLALQTPRSIDASSQSEITIPLTLVNKGHRPAIVRFRPETLGFEVLGPGGAEHCAWPALATAPTRDLFTTLGPSGSVDLTVMLSAYCPTRVFRQAGFYVVRASFDTRKASGAEIGLRSFDGQVIATAPTLIRLRHGQLEAPLVRPRLAPPK